MGMGGGSEDASQSGQGFERVFDLVSGHGRFQWRLLFILALQLIVLTWHNIGYAFLGNVPDHWCLVPDLQTKDSNWTLKQQKIFSIPQEISDDKASGKVRFKRCEYFHLNYTDILAESSSFEEAYAKVDWKNVTTRECSRWEYDRSIYHSTVVTEFDLVCGNRWKAATIQGSYMTGNIVGSLSAAALSDRFLGRRKTILISLSMMVVGGILAAFSTSYWMFVLFRVIVGIGVTGSAQNCFVLLTEHADKSYRALLAIVDQLPFAVGYMILPGLAYLFRDWNNLQLSFGVISVHLVVYYWVLPESPRWLATHGHTSQAVDALLKIAQVNGMPPPNREDLEKIVAQCQDRREQQHYHKEALTDGDPSRTVLNRIIPKWLRAVVLSFKKLLETAEIRKRSMVFWTIYAIVAMVYYGIVFSGNITSDPYLLMFLSGLMEVPAYTLIVPFVSKLGRRPTIAGNFILTGVFMLGLATTPNAYEMARIILALMSKLFVSAGYAIIYLLGAELYPTEMRTMGLAVGVFAGRIGSISAAYIVIWLQYVSRDMSTVIFGVAAVGGGLVSLLLPETKTREMSDKVAEIEL